jgi:hypothetical protein
MSIQQTCGIDNDLFSKRDAMELCASGVLVLYSKIAKN